MRPSEMNEKKLLPVLLIAAAAVALYFFDGQGGQAPLNPPASPTQPASSIQASSSGSDSRLQTAFERRESDFQIEGRGVVAKVLPDDNKGSRHQRFILRLNSGQTVLVAHNIDLAPKVKGLKKGDEVAFYGEYEWSGQGGVIHWTHRDPQGRHPDGWLKHEGEVYR